MIEIRRPRERTDLELPTELLRRDLMECHGHIRRFSALAVRLTTRPDVSPSEASEAARALLGYFERALPLHVADEDDSLRPRLLALPDDAVLAAAVTRMHDEHGPIEALLAEAIPAWRRLLGDPRLLGDHRDVLAAAARELEHTLAAHLAAEEAVVFPALTRLEDEAAVAIRREMRQRRVSAPTVVTTAAIPPA